MEKNLNFTNDVLYVDDRELKSKVTTKLKKLNVKFEVRRLDVGDYVYNDMIFERKTIQDFWGSIQGRLWEQVYNMKLNSDKCYILVSGSFKELFWTTKYFNENIFYGAIASLVTKYNVQVLRCETETQLVKQMLKIIEKSKEPATQIYKKLGLKTEDIYVNMLTCIPGIGVRQAQAILEKFSYQQLLVASENDLTVVKNIGIKKAKEIKSYLHT